MIKKVTVLSFVPFTPLYLSITVYDDSVKNGEKITLHFNEFIIHH